jgi:hypothetical protein
VIKQYEEILRKEMEAKTKPGTTKEQKKEWKRGEEEEMK